jgi:head-tail adaptor
LPFVDGLLDPYKVSFHMNPISAGMLTRRIKVQRPSTIRDSSEPFVRTCGWTSRRSGRDIQPLSGKEAVIADRISAEI